MKKIVLFILGVLLFIPMVFADMGAPAIQPYEVTVESSNGAIVYREEGEIDDPVYVATNLKIGPGAVIIIEDGWTDSDEYVEFLYIDKGTEFVHVISSDEYDSNKSDTYSKGFVESKELTAVQKSYKFNEKNFEKATKAYITGDVEIRLGPGYKYKSTGTIIPAKTSVNVRRQKDSDGTNTAWFYVDYNGTKGYISETNGEISFSSTENDFITMKKTEIINPTTKEINETIGENTIIHAKIYELEYSTRRYYIEYDGKNGFVDRNDIVLKGKKVTFKAQSDLNLYYSLDYDENNNHKQIGTIKEGTSFNSDYYELYMADGAYIYYVNGNSKGWIDGFHNVDNESLISQYSTINDEERNQEMEESVITEPEPSSNEPEVIEQTTKISIYYYIGGAVILFLVAIVTIILINRKKKVVE